MVIHCTLRVRIITRFWIPNVEVFADGDQKLNPHRHGRQGHHADGIYPDSAGIFHYEITDDPRAAAS
jgi:hypothetical protein